MHLDKLIEIFEKSVILYNTQIERAVLEHLLRLRSIERKGKRYLKEPESEIATIKDFALELSINYPNLYSMLKKDESSPKPISGDNINNNALIHYNRKEFYNWWNGRKHRKKKSQHKSV